MGSILDNRLIKVKDRAGNQHPSGKFFRLSTGIHNGADCGIAKRPQSDSAPFKRAAVRVVETQFRDLNIPVPHFKAVADRQAKWAAAIFWILYFGWLKLE